MGTAVHMAGKSDVKLKTTSERVRKPRHGDEGMSDLERWTKMRTSYMMRFAMTLGQAKLTNVLRAYLAVRRAFTTNP